MPDQKQKMTPKELLDLYSKSGNFIWTDDRKSDVVWIETSTPEEKKHIAVINTIRVLLPTLNIASQHLTRQWITKACDIVGFDKFVPDSVFHNEEKRQKRNLWFNDIIEQVNIQHAYHRKESHKIARLKKDFEKKRRRIIAKMVTARLNADSEPINFNFHSSARRVGKTAFQTAQMLNRIRKHYPK